MLGTRNELTATGNSQEDAMRYNVNLRQSREHYDQGLYKEAARRVVYENCLGACELTREDVPHFNAQFYFNQKDRQVCIQDCFNTRMQLHFGQAAVKEGMLMDFEDMKNEYRNYERWNPRNKIYKKYISGHEEKEVADITAALINKTRNANSQF